MIEADLLPGAKPKIAVRFVGVTDESSDLLAQEVVGGRWRNGIKRWVYPGTAEKCREMREAWGSNLKVSTELAQWFRAISRAQKVQVAASTQQDAVLRVVPRVAPTLYADLAPDQRVGAAWVSTAYRGAGIYAPEMGVGKTRSVIAGLIERQVNGRILIVCPKVSVRSVWGREVEKYTDIPVFLARGTRKQREAVLHKFWNADGLYEAAGKPRVLVIVAEMLRIKAKMKNGKILSDESGKSTFTGFQFPELFDKRKPWDAIVVDESQKILASVTVVKATLTGAGLKRLPQTATTTSLRLAVTATPYGDGGEVHGMFGTLHWCWPNEYTSFWNFASENFEVGEKAVSKTRTVKTIGPLRREGGVETFFKSLGPRVFRRTLEEVSPDHVGKLKFWIQECEMDPAQEKQYRYLSDNAEVMTPGGILVANGVLAELTRARQVANGEVNVREVIVKRWVPVLDDETGEETDEEELQEFPEQKVFFAGASGKIESLLDNLDERGILDGRGKRKVVIASQFNEFLELVAEALDVEGVPYHYMTGKTTDRQREQMMATFQTGLPTAHTGQIRRCPECQVFRNQWHGETCPRRDPGPRVFLMNSRAGGVSITLDAADEMHQLDEMYPPEANEQLHRRIFRRSRVHVAHIVYYRSIGTVDQNIADTVGTKLVAQLKTMDGRRGRSIVRELVKMREGK